MKNNLKKAKVLFYRGAYGDLLKLLEPLIFDYSESCTFFELLGFSCLYSLDFHGAESYLGKLKRLDSGNVPAMLGLALIHMKRNESKESAAVYLRILEIDPGCREAKAGLAYLKKSKDGDRIADFFDNGKFVRLLPPALRKKSALRRNIPVLMVLAGFTLIFGLSFLYVKQQQHRIQRPELKEISITSIHNFTGQTGSELRFSDQEVKTLLQNAYRYVNQYRDNRAQLEINRIMLSNASTEVRNMALILQGIITEPDFSSLMDNFEYEDVVQYPALYQNCYVIWSGRAANIDIGEDLITFDFLVGYHDGRVLRGIVPAQLRFAARLIENMPVELLSRIQTRSDGGLLLDVKAVHRLMP